jgi:hypothetical protein
MTKENFTSITVIADASGSMAGLTTDTIGGFNKFLTDQQALPGDAIFSLCVFNHDYRLVHDCVKLAGVPALDAKVYSPSGNTALYDAVGTTIESVGTKLAAMPEEERPSKVIFLIITDGQENSSHRFTQSQIKSMITHQREKYSWEFVFMGANIDAVKEGSSIGVAAYNSVSYNATKGGTHQLYGSVSSNMSSLRGSRAASAQVDFFSQTGQTPTGTGTLAGTGTPAGTVLPVPTTTTTTTTTTTVPVVPPADTNPPSSK